MELAVKSSDIIHLNAITGSLRSFEFLFLLFDFPEDSCDQVIPGSFDVDGAEVIFPNVKVEKGKSEVALTSTSETVSCLGFLSDNKLIIGGKDRIEVWPLGD